MSRYMPTPEEADALRARGWRDDAEGWWWPTAETGLGRTYKEAVREQNRRDRDGKGDDRG